MTPTLLMRIKYGLPIEKKLKKKLKKKKKKGDNSFGLPIEIFFKKKKLHFKNVVF
jgi:hypothetical protein